MRMQLGGALAFLLAGCNGHLWEVADPGDYPKQVLVADKPDNSVVKVNGVNPNQTGVRVYMPAPMKVTMETTTFTEDKKQPTYDCDHKQFQQIQVRPDYSRPLRVYYEPGWFESTTFSVNISPDGSLASVNAGGTPPAAAVAAAVLVALKQPGDGADRHICNTDPVVVRIERCESAGPVVCSLP